MACKLLFIRPVFFVRWTEPKMADIAEIQRELEAACGRHGGPVIYMAIVPEESAPPDDKTREGFINAMQNVLEHCETMHLIIEGQGFKHAILRSAVTGVLLVRGQRSKVFVHKKLEDALAAASDLASKRSKFSASQVLRLAREAGVASAEAPSVKR